MNVDTIKPAAGEGPLPISYSAAEVCRNFMDLLATFDFAVAFQELGIGSLSVFKRNMAKKRLTAISIALWHVALEQSFPQNTEEFYAYFLEHYRPLQGDGKAAQKLRQFLEEYDSLVQQKKNTDFTCVADNLALVFKISEKDKARQQLRLSLHVRSLYDLIFDKLI